MGKSGKKQTHTRASLSSSTQVTKANINAKVKGGKISAAQAAKSQKAGFAFNTGVGQHILKNPQVVESMIQKSGLKSTDVALEIGPGTGNLTIKILEKCKRMNAFELDPRMHSELTKRVDDMGLRHKIDIHLGNVLDVKQLPYFDICIANLPYQISSEITFKLLQHRPTFRCAVLMFQLEFVDRLCAKPGDTHYCRLSVNTQLIAKCDKIMNVKKNNFRPPPKVESAVVRIEPIHPPPPINMVEWDGLTRICFGRKNKTIAANFKTKPVISMLENNYKVFLSKTNQTSKIPDMKLKVEQILGQQYNEDDTYGTLRARKMTQDDFLKLMLAFKPGFRKNLKK